MALSATGLLLYVAISLHKLQDSQERLKKKWSDLEKRAGYPDLQSQELLKRQSSCLSSEDKMIQRLHNISAAVKVSWPLPPYLKTKSSVFMCRKWCSDYLPNSLYLDLQHHIFLPDFSHVLKLPFNNIETQWNMRWTFFKADMRAEIRQMQLAAAVSSSTSEMSLMKHLFFLQLNLAESLLWSVTAPGYTLHEALTLLHNTFLIVVPE